MEDKEVGECWRKGHYDGLPHSHPSSAVTKLIRKLVADRQTLWWHQLAKRPGGTNPQEALRYALRDFGIDPATWEQNRED